MARFSLALIACCAACSREPTPSVTVPNASVTSPPPVPGTLATACSIRAGAPRELAIPRALSALAPQYFHPSVHDDGFNDLVPGTARYQWYDPANLDVAIEPPPDMTMIRRSTKSFYFGRGAGPTFIAHRTDTKATQTDLRGYDVDMVEDARGHAWVLTANFDPGTMTNVELLDVDPQLGMRTHAVVILPGIDAWDRRIGLTADGHVAVVWVERAEDGLLLMASWLGPDGFRSLGIVDRVYVPAPAIELALRSTTNLRVASEGSDRIAFAWRPIVPKDNEVVDTGTASHPPEHAATAEVRIGSTDLHGATRAPKVHPAQALPLGGVSGMGPWPVQGNGMASASIAGHAVFFWLDDARVVYATLDAVPRPITSGSFRLLPRPVSRTSAELLLLESVGPQKAVTVACE